MKRNKFSLSHYKLSTTSMGLLVPISCYEVLPGDTVQQATSCFIRCTPLVTPPMHPVSIKVHHWYVPNRIIWPEFEEFITGGDYGSTPPIHPFMVAPSGIQAGALGDHFGLPLNTNNLTFSALPFRAYARIYNENYRDQDLSPELVWDDGSGADSTTNTVVQPCNWAKDYYTQARPWPQKSPDITIPMGNPSVVSSGQAVQMRATSSSGTDRALQAKVVGPNDVQLGGATLASDSNSLWFGTNTGLLAAGGTINQLREAFALQRYAEARARYGSRYTEYLRFLGVQSSDARLQRPEYLGGGKTTLQFSEVLQTGPNSTDGSQIVGDMFGHGMASMRSNRYRRFFEEHGFVVSLLSVMPKPVYSQGLHKMWSRGTREDYHQKELEHIGQQPIYDSEIYTSDATYPANQDTIFGWTNRYQEYRYHPSSVASGFRPGSLYEDWHFARDFAAQPVLNDSFLRGAVTKRPFADQVNENLLIMSRHSIQARRMLSKHAQSYVL